MTKTVHGASLAERLLLESICRREEAAGHPAPANAADAAALREADDFATRLRHRARGLEGSAEALTQIERALNIGRIGVLLLIALAAAAGVLAASIALDRAASVSLPLVLFALVGFNLLMLAIWVLSLVLGARSGSAFASVWQSLARKIARPSSAAFDALRLLAEDARARWRFGALVHAAWLSYTLAGLATLVLLLILRRYELSWQTTLLDAEGLRGLAEALSFAPRLLGAPGPDSLALAAPMSDVDRRGWAQWIVLAVLAYGVLPRLFALAVCASLSRPLYPLAGTALGRPGYARLRARLMPDRRMHGVVDADHAPRAAAAAPASADLELPATALHAVALEWAAPAPATGPRWQRVLQVDDGDSRATALRTLREDSVKALVVLLRATATPDRGLERSISALGQAARAPTWIALGELDQLAARGTAASAQRIADWRTLAAEAGAQGGVLDWNAGEPRPIAESRA